MIPNPKILPTAEAQGNTILVKRAGGNTGENIVVEIYLVTNGTDGANPVATLNGVSNAVNGDISITSGALDPGTYHVIMTTSKNGQTTSDSDATVVIMAPPPPP